MHLPSCIDLVMASQLWVCVVLIIDEARDCGFLSCVVIHQYVDFITIDMH